MRDLDPAVLYSKMPPPPEPVRPAGPAEEGARFFALYPSMRDSIERQYQIKLPEPPESHAPPSARDAGEAAADLRAVTTWARTAGVAPDAATSLRSAASEALALTPEARQAQSDKWAAESSSAFGANLETVVGLARSAVPPELKPVLNRTGLGNRPDVVRMFADLARRRGGR